jgi:hypothetical protein
MSRRVLSIILIGLLMNAVEVRSVTAQSQDQQIQNIEKIKEGVRKLGTGEEARVELKLKDGRRLKGYIREAGEDTFVVVDAKNGTATTVTYGDVKQIKGKNRLTAAKVGITIVKGVAVVAAVAGITMLLMLLIIPKT